MLSKTRHVVEILLCSLIQTTKLSGKHEKSSMLLLGFLATTMFPFFVLLSICEVIINMINGVIIPFISIIVMLIIGLPVLSIIRWIYGTYLFIYNLLLNIYQMTVKLQKRRKRDRSNKEILNRTQLVHNRKFMHGDTIQIK